MNIRIFSLAGLLCLASCAYAVDGSLQDIQFETPGAQNAECIVDIDGFRHVVQPPGVINVTKSDETMVLSCRAPGNRVRVVEVEPVFNDFFVPGAIATGGAGGVWDYASNSAYRYPDVIEVDFTAVPIRDEPLPDHNAPDIRQPEDYMLEEFLPSNPRLNSDRYEPPVELRRRQRPSQTSSLSSGYNNDNPAYIDSELENVDFKFGGKSELIEVLQPEGALPESDSEDMGNIDDGPVGEGPGPIPTTDSSVEIVPLPQSSPTINSGDSGEMSPVPLYPGQ